MDFTKACGHTVLLAETSIHVLRQMIEVCECKLLITAGLNQLLVGWFNVCNWKYNYITVLYNKKLGECWDNMIAEQLDTAKVQNFTFFHTPLAFLRNWDQRIWYHDLGQRQHADSQDANLFCRIHFHFLLHCVIIIHQCYKQMEKQSRHHACSMYSSIIDILCQCFAT